MKGVLLWLALMDPLLELAEHDETVIQKDTRLNAAGSQEGKRVERNELRLMVLHCWEESRGNLRGR